ncbi:hypothetical protein ACLOJK_034443, partial [Asimina triloba]
MEPTIVDGFQSMQIRSEQPCHSQIIQSQAASDGHIQSHDHAKIRATIEQHRSKQQGQQTHLQQRLDLMPTISITAAAHDHQNRWPTRSAVFQSPWRPAEESSTVRSTTWPAAEPIFYTAANPQIVDRRSNASTQIIQATMNESRTAGKRG